MDILLFNQYFTSKKGDPEKNVATLPTNLLCLASYLKSKGTDCKIYELGAFDTAREVPEPGGKRVRYGLSDGEIEKIIKDENPKIIGLGCMYSIHYMDVVNIARLIKKVDPAIKVVIGGNHATSLCDVVLKNPCFDFVVRGEGEITFYELCCGILSGQEDFSGIDGLAFLDKDQVIKTPARELIRNLDDLPPTDYSLVDVRKYVDISSDAYIMRPPSVGIVSSRGCPGGCVYCTVKAVWGRSWRGKSPKRTVDEMEAICNRYGIREFAFLDDSASVDKVRWNAICDEIIERKLDIKWTTPNGIAHWTLDKPTLKKMKKSGCYRITFGIESGNAETRKFLGKPHPLVQAKELIRYANKIGLWTICTNIVGFPYETRQQMEETIDFAKKSGTDFAVFYALFPQVTSDVYKYFKDEGFLDLDCVFSGSEFDEEKYEEMFRILQHGGVRTKYFSAEEIKAIQAQAYKSFIVHRALGYLFNPLHLLRKVRSAEDLKYLVKLIRTGIKILARSFYARTTRALLYNQHEKKKE